MLNLDVANKSYVEIEVILDGQTNILKFYKETGKQRKAQRAALKQKETRVFELEELFEEQFFERLEGKEEIIKKIKEYYDDNGGLDEFREECEKALGKLNKKA